MDTKSNIECNSCKSYSNNKIYNPINSNRSVDLFICNNCGVFYSLSTKPYISRPTPSMSCDANRSSIKYTKRLVLEDHLKFLGKIK